MLDKFCKNINKNSYQRIYDKVLRHLVKQGKVSVDRKSGQCKYRGPNGTSCAVGCLISDEEYFKGLDNQSNNFNNNITDVAVYFGLKIKKSKLTFLEDLQEMHDYSFFTEDLIKRSNEVAKRYKLKRFVFPKDFHFSR